MRTYRWSWLLAASLLAPAGGFAKEKEKGPNPAELLEEESDGPQEGEQELIEFTRRRAPEMHERIERAMRRDPEGTRRKLRRFRPMMRDPQLREQMARNMEIEMKVRRLARALRVADADKKEPLKKELEAALNAQFDAKVAAQELRLKKMESDIAELKTRLEKRRGLKDKLVSKRLGELADSEEGWEW